MLSKSEQSPRRRLLIGLLIAVPTLLIIWAYPWTRQWRTHPSRPDQAGSLVIAQVPVRASELPLPVGTPQPQPSPGLPPAEPRRPVGAAAASTLDNAAATAEQEHACQQNAAANGVALKRFARKLKAKPEFLLEIYASPLEGPREEGAGLFKYPLRTEMSRCYRTAGGVVSLALRSVTGCTFEDCDDIKVHTDVVFIKGTQQVRAQMPPMSVEPGLVQYLYSLGGAFDYDGDGIPEVFLVSNYWEESELPDDTIELKSIKRGKLVPYPYSPPLSPNTPSKDIDGDGRPDLYSAGPYARVYPHANGPQQEPKEIPPLFVYHSLPDGHFSADDAMAQASLLKACPDATFPAVAALRAQAVAQKAELADLFIRTIVCARARGKSASDVMQALKSECHRWVEDGGWDDAGEFVIDVGKVAKYTCPNWLKELVAVTPPLVLPGQAK